MTLWRRLRDDKAAQPVSDRELEKLLETAERLTERLEPLEMILVEESQDWRTPNE